MSIHGYTGNVITANPTAPTVSVATGVWTIEQQLQAMAAGNWPMAATQISRSLRFNSADSAYLNRTPASASNRRTWTWSGWVKKSVIAGDYPPLFNAGQSAPDTVLRFSDTDNLSAILENGGGGNSTLITTQVFRDPSAWYHIVWAVDTTNATANNRSRLYVNGTEITAFGTRTNPSQNFDTNVNNTVQHRIGGQRYASYFNGYITEINFVDGLALTPASFGNTNSSTGVWQPIQYTGPYGTNGFYLNFSDNSGTTSTTLGKDSSGNGNNWTPNNLSVTAGAGNDSLVDSPTAYGTDTGAGGSVRGNYATWNPLRPSGATITNGNLDATTGNTGSANGGYLTGTFWMPTSGKYYFEVTPTNVNEIAIGLTTNSNNRAAIYYRQGEVYINGSVSFTGSSYTDNDVIGVAVDMDALTIRFYKNNTAQGSGTSSLSAMTGPFVPAIVHLSGAGSSVAVANFGQRAFAYTAPSGFKALCTTNLPTPTIGATSTTQANDYFNTVLYTGTGSSLSVTGVGFQPDWVWIKERNAAADHGLYDAVRGVQKQLESNTTTAETTETTGLTAFGADGFTVGALAQLNTSADTYVAWNWNAGGSNATNTSGTITSTVRANTTSGFSVVTYTGNGTGGATVGHGLGVAPSMVIVKSRSSTTSWFVAQSSLATNANLLLNTTDRAYTNSEPSGFGSGVIGGLSSTTFQCVAGTVSPSNVANINTNGATYVAYCFAPVAGYSAFGSYTGNGSTDGPFVYTGFRPRYVLIKKTQTGSGDGDWYIFDTARDTYNVANLKLWTNLSSAENSNPAGDSSTTNNIDILSNGFKAKTVNGATNQNGIVFIYAAFAESPFKYALAR